jgi:hypothetical protein
MRICQPVFAAFSGLLRKPPEDRQGKNYQNRNSQSKDNKCGFLISKQKFQNLFLDFVALL